MLNLSTKKQTEPPAPTPPCTQPSSTTLRSRKSKVGPNKRQFVCPYTTVGGQASFSRVSFPRGLCCLMNPQESSGSQVRRGQGELRTPGKMMSSTDVGVGDQSSPKHEVGQEKGHKGLKTVPLSIHHTEVERLSSPPPFLTNYKLPDGLLLLHLH